MRGGIKRLAGDGQHGQEGGDHADLRREVCPRFEDLGLPFSVAAATLCLRASSNWNTCTGSSAGIATRLTGDLGLDQGQSFSAVSS